MTTSHESICCSEVNRAVEKKGRKDVVQYLALLTTKVFIYSVCLDVWVLQTAYFNYRQHYGVAEEKAVQLSVVIRLSRNYLG